MRLSVGHIDAYRRYMDEDEDMTLDELLAWIRGTAPEAHYIKAGKAFHTILERSNVGELDRVSLDGINFRFDIDECIALPPIRELKGELVIMTSVGPVTLVGKVDGIYHDVMDLKLAGRYDPEKYLASYQWRCYLLMFNAWKFIYRVFGYDLKDILAPGSKTRGKNRKVIGQEYVINEYNELPLYRYPDMERDVLRQVDEVARFVAEYMPEKLEATANWQSEPRLVSTLTLAKAA